MINLAALHQALDAAVNATLAAEAGEMIEMTVYLLEASAASAVAFPAGSPEAAAFGQILTAITIAGTDHLMPGEQVA